MPLDILNAIAIERCRLYHNAMFAAYMLPLVIAVAGLLAGTCLGTFMGAALGAAAAVWRIRLALVPVHRFFATLDPDTPDGAILLNAFRNVLDHIRDTKRAALLRVSALTASERSGLKLSLTRSGDLELACDGQRARALGQPGVWVADHPLPLDLPATHCLTLRFAPTEGGRARVSLAFVPPLARWVWAGVVALASAACAFDIGWLFTAALGFALQTCLLEHNAHRANRHP